MFFFQCLDHLDQQGWSRWEPGDKTDDGKRSREICPVKKGYGMAVSCIRPLEGATMYSVASKLPCTLQSSMEKARIVQADYQHRFPSIKDLIQTSALPFFVKKVNPDVCVDADAKSVGEDGRHTQITLQNWACPGNSQEGGMPIDISVEDAMRATNSSSMENACCLLEVAAAAGALSLVVCYNQYRPGKEQLRSCYYAYPLVDTKILLQGIPTSSEAEGHFEEDENSQEYVFSSGFKLPDDDNGDFEPMLRISRQSTHLLSSGAVIQSPDFMLCDSQTIPKKAYAMRLLHPVLKEDFVVWKGFVNMSKPQMQMQGMCFFHSLSHFFVSGTDTQSRCWHEHTCRSCICCCCCDFEQAQPEGQVAPAEANTDSKDGHPSHPVIVLLIIILGR